MGKIRMKHYLEYRTSIYYVLKNFFLGEPEIDSIMEIVSMCQQCKAQDVVHSSKEEQEFIQFFQSITKNRVQKEITEIRAEYARLFWGPKKVVAPPFESVYKTESRRLFGETTKFVEDFYHNAGLKIQTTDHLPSDFIGYELEFMYFLSHETLLAFGEESYEKIEKLFHYQDSFLTHHLASWITPFQQDIANGTNMELFSVVSRFADAFIQNDVTLLQQLMEQ